MEKIIKQKCFWCLFSHVLVACLSTVLSNPMTPRPWVFSAPVLASPRQDDLQYHSLTVATTHTFSLYIYIFFKLFYGPFLLQLLHTSSSLCKNTFHFIAWFCFSFSSMAFFTCWKFRQRKIEKLMFVFRAIWCWFPPAVWCLSRGKAMCHLVYLVVFFYLSLSTFI